MFPWVWTPHANPKQDGIMLKGELPLLLDSVAAHPLQQL